MTSTKQQDIEQVFNTMWQIRKLLESQAQESHEERTATMMQYSTLKFLKSNKHSTVGDIGAHLHLSKSSATQLIERLVKNNLVERLNDQGDRRIVRLSITLAGEAKIIDLKKKFMDKIGKILSNIPDEDLKDLIRIHTNLIETLQKAQTK